MALLTLAQCKDHLHITTPPGDAGDADLTLKLAQAEAIVLDYLKSGADPAWTNVTVPLNVQAAILLLVAHLFEHRGDDMDAYDAPLWSAIERLLMRHRDPALA